MSLLAATHSESRLLIALPRCRSRGSGAAGDLEISGAHGPVPGGRVGVVDHTDRPDSPHPSAADKTGRPGGGVVDQGELLEGADRGPALVGRDDLSPDRR